MKYKLLRDLPCCKAGEIIDFDMDTVISPDRFSTNLQIVLNCWKENPDWFAPVRWEPTREEPYCFIDTRGHEQFTIHTGAYDDYARIAIGNCFRTSKALEKTAEKIRGVLAECERE